jgi:hypothetical protein
MKHSRLIAGVAGLAIAAAGTGAAVAAKQQPAPTSVTVKEKYSLKLKPNRYIQDGMRWAKDVYIVKSGGTVKVVLNKDQEGPHSFSVVRQKDLPKTGDEAFNHCKPCNTYSKAHGIDPNNEGPPQHQYVENGQGQDEPPNLNKPGDSGIVGPNKGDTITFHVTAPAGKTLHFMCIFHPWMQAKVKVR